MNNQPSSGDYSNFTNDWVYKEVPLQSACLDVGCWVGDLGSRLIKKKECTVDGLDFNNQVLKKAKDKGYRNTFQINLNNPVLDLSIIKYKYDCIIFADVLEHLVNPQLILARLKKNLTKSGVMIISVPNVAFIQNRINLLLGRWNYTEFGTLDKTHLKFFTQSSMQKMLSMNGFRIKKTQPYNQFKGLDKFKLFTDIRPTLFCYQLLFVISPYEK